MSQASEMKIPVAGALLSGLLLYATFPPLGWSPLGWIALAPLIIACAYLTPRQAFKTGFFAGVAFWLPSIAWMTHVTYGGWFALGCYCALFTAGFSLCVAWWVKRFEGPGLSRIIAFIIFIPMFWVGFEFIRSTLFTGFPWNQLGVSQAVNTLLIQCAQLGGVYLVSYLMLAVNTAMAVIIARRLRANAAVLPAVGLSTAMLVAAIGFCYLYGRHARRQVHYLQAETIRVGVIQPNVPQNIKWSDDWSGDIRKRLRLTTQGAIARYKPDMIVWPETALPDFILNSPASSKLVADLLTNGIPILAGSMDFHKDGEAITYFNSSFLFSADTNTPTQIYAKRHLVLFGEYIPLVRFFPWLQRLSPIEENFSPGATDTLFKLAQLSSPFAVLICFEDILAQPARRLVRKGARLLINQTNDAWFDLSCASLQHMAHCVFRSVENHVPAIRVTNTGLTCQIDEHGSVRAFIEPVKTLRDGPVYAAFSVSIPPTNMPLTFYTRYGDLFALGCTGFTLPILAAALLTIFRRNKPIRHKQAPAS